MSVAVPRVAEIHNIGGGRFSNASVLEAISLSEEIVGEQLNWTYEEAHRIGDHIWWIGDNGRFKSHYSTGNSNTTCGGSSRRCTRRTPSAGARGWTSLERISAVPWPRTG